MKTTLLVLTLLLAATFPALAAPQTKCPVMGGDIDKEIHIDYEGRRIYFCCPGCDAKFQATPEKFLRKMKADGVALEAVPKPQTRCPVMGGKIDRELFADREGLRVYFCCPACRPQFEKSPAVYLKKMQKSGVRPEPSPAAENAPAAGEEDHSGHNH